MFGKYIAVGDKVFYFLKMSTLDYIRYDECVVEIAYNGIETQVVRVESGYLLTYYYGTKYSTGDERAPESIWRCWPIKNEYSVTLL